LLEQCSEHVEKSPIKSALQEHSSMHQSDRDLIYIEDLTSEENPDDVVIMRKQASKEQKKTFKITARKSTNPATREGVKKPMNRMHCDHCDLSFRQADLLLSHITRVHRTNQFQCGECKRTFVDEYLLNRHKKTHEKKLFYCQVCDKRFRRSEDLLRHSQKHKRSTSTVTDDNCVDAEEDGVQVIPCTENVDILLPEQSLEPQTCEAQSTKLTEQNVSFCASVKYPAGVNNVHNELSSDSNHKLQTSKVNPGELSIPTTRQHVPVAVFQLMPFPPTQSSQSLTSSNSTFSKGIQNEISVSQQTSTHTMKSTVSGSSGHAVYEPLAELITEPIDVPVDQDSLKAAREFMANNPFVLDFMVKSEDSF